MLYNRIAFAIPLIPVISPISAAAFIASPIRGKRVAFASVVEANASPSTDSGAKPIRRIYSSLLIVSILIDVLQQLVFALFHNTLLYLRTRLAKKGIRSSLIYGETKDRQDVLNDFQYNNDVNILLSSEVGSEGLDLQFCDTIVNYDLPWDPMVVEQRIGRVDRFGQKSKKVHIYNLVVKGSIQEVIYTRLLDRIGIFKSSIGDLEAILDKYLEESNHKNVDITRYFENLEYELYDPELSQSERDRKIDDMYDAVLREKKEIKDIEDNMENWLTNDQSFRNELQQCQDHKLYITEKEEVAFIKLLIRKADALSTCSLDEVDKEKGIYVFRMPKSNAKILRQFMLNNEDRTKAVSNMDFRSFRQATMGEEPDIYITFNQETAFENKKLHFVNSFHPLIRSALKFFNNEEKAGRGNTFRYSIRRNNSLKDLEAGTYFLALYRTEYRRVLAGNEQEVAKIIPVLYNWDRRGIVHGRELASLFMGEAQENASVNNGRYEFNDKDIYDMQCDMNERVEEIFDEQFNAEKEKMDFQKNREMEHISEYYDRAIREWKEKIRDDEETIRIYEEKAQHDNDKYINGIKSRLTLEKFNLGKKEQEEEEKLHKLEEDKMERSNPPTIISLSVVNLI